MVSEKQVMDQLKNCIDPEIGINIVDLGLVYGVEVKDSAVKVRMTLTTPACPMCSYFVKDVEEKVGAMPGVEKAEVQLVWEPAWSPEKMSPAAKKQLGIG